MFFDNQTNNKINETKIQEKDSQNETKVKSETKRINIYLRITKNKNSTFLLEVM